jgi:spoIIIJ-associated protein
MDEDDDLLLNHQHEGLSSLQTIVQTMWSHQTKSSLRVNIDVNGFRSRRETQLINMAKRMAERVVASGKPITLEPMPANERRIIHMTLREEPGVTTESFGEGPSRKVQIKPQSK